MGRDLDIGNHITEHAVLGVTKSIIEKGTVNGQVAFWNSPLWRHTEVAEISWDDSNKRLIFGASAGANALDLGEKNIINVSDIALDTISSAAGTTISVILGTDASDDFIVGNNNAFVVEGDTDNVGINIATPTKTLDVRGDMLFKSISGNDGAIEFEVVNNTTILPVVFKNTGTGSMGMGILAPSGQNSNFILRHGTSSGDGFNVGIDTSNPADLVFTSRNGGSNTERMRIENTGTVGIKTTSTTGQLNVKGLIYSEKDTAYGYALQSGTSLNARFGLKYGTAGNVGDSDLLMLTNRETNGELAFATTAGAGETERLRLDNAGNMGLNEQNPDATFEMITSSNTQEGLKIKGSASQSGTLLLLTDSSDNSYIDSGDGLTSSIFTGNVQGVDIDFLWKGNAINNLFYIDAGNDRVGIGTNAPNGKLEVNISNVAINANFIDPFSIGETDVHFFKNDALVVVAGVANNSATRQGNFVGRRSRGTLTNPTTLVDGDTVFAINAQGHDGTQARGQTAAVQFNVDGAVSTNVIPMEIRFITSEDITNNQLTRMFIKSTGLIGINEADPDAMLEIVTSATTEEGLKIKGSASQTGALLNLVDSSDNIYITSGDGLTGSEFRGNDQNVDIDFVWEGSNEDNLFLIDAGNDEVRMGDGDTNYSSFASDGTQIMVGTARIIKHVQAIDELGRGQSAPTVRFNEIPYVSYTYAEGDDSHITFEIPEDMDFTAAVAIKVHWYTDVAGQTDDDVNWQVVWNARNPGEAVNAGSTTISSGDTAVPAQWIIAETTIGAIAANSIAAGDIIGIDFERIAVAGTDPDMGSVHVLSVEFEYTSNKLGEAI